MLKNYLDYITFLYYLLLVTMSLQLQHERWQPIVFPIPCSDLNTLIDVIVQHILICFQINQPSSLHITLILSCTEVLNYLSLRIIIRKIQWRGIGWKKSALPRFPIKRQGMWWGIVAYNFEYMLDNAGWFQPSFWRLMTFFDRVGLQTNEI